MSSETPDWNAPGPGGNAPQGAGTQQGAYPGGTEAEPPHSPGQHAPLSPVDETATRVTGRRVIQYIIDYILAGIIPGLAYWLLDRGSGFLHGLGWLLATVIAVGGYYWYWVERPRSHAGQTFGMQLLGPRVITKDATPASRAPRYPRGILLILDTLFYCLVGFITMSSSRYHQP